MNCYSTLPRTGLNQRSISDIHRGLSNNRMSYCSCATNDAYPLSSNLRSANNFSLSIFHFYSFSQFMSSHKESIKGRGTCCTTNTHTQHTISLNKCNLTNAYQTLIDYSKNWNVPRLSCAIPVAGNGMNLWTIIFLAGEKPSAFCRRRFKLI